MPELPEVEVTRRRISPFLRDRVIARVVTTAPSYFFLTPPTTLSRRLRGATIRELRRHGKYLLACFGDGSSLLLHLGMTGQLFTQSASSPRLLRSTAGAAKTPEAQSKFTPDQHTHLQLHFDDGGQAVYFRDVRKFGKVRWLAAGEIEPRLSKLGVDALAADTDTLWLAARSRKIPIKSLLLDQSVIAGVGNIYADEALFAAGVRPTRRCDRVSRTTAASIVVEVKRILLRSIETGGSSISDYISPDGSDGGYQDERMVYARKGLPCPRCARAIQRVVIAQRGSHFCSACQR